MGFDIGNNVSKRISLEQLTKGLDPTKDKKKIDRITQIFNKYNTNTEGSSAKVLDMDEQVSIMTAYHKAVKNGDNNVTRSGLRNSGIKGEYKAYRDFMEAYQNAVGETQNTFDLSFKDVTEDKSISQVKAVQNTEVEGKKLAIEHEYINSDEGNKKVKTTLSSEDGQVSYTPKGQMIRQKVGESTLNYHYDNEAKNAKPNIITVRTPETYETVKLQQDGTYFDDKNNVHYHLNNNKLLDEFTVDDKGRVTNEFYGDNEYSYNYDETSNQPTSIKVKTNDDKEVEYTNEKGVYSTENNNKKEYYNFDAEKREFSPTNPPKPDKQNRPQTKHLIRMTQGWRNQRINKDNSLTEQFNAMSSADEVLNVLVAKNEKFKDAKLNTETLRADFVRNNPSMFTKDGEIYADAKWEKLDFPTDLSKYAE